MKSKYEKREEAQERQAYYNGLTKRQKLDQILKRPGKSARETAKILSRD